MVDALGAVADPSGLALDLILDPTVAIPGLVSGVTDFVTSGRLSLLLPANLRGQEATLYFDLFDQGYGAITQAALDNLGMTPVPAPGTLALLLAGLAAAARRKRGNGPILAGLGA